MLRAHWRSRPNDVPQVSLHSTGKQIMKTSIALKTLLGAASLALPLMVFAESNVQTGAGTLNATAHVDFQLVIPQILYLRVGTGIVVHHRRAGPANPTVDQIVFNVPTAPGRAMALPLPLPPAVISGSASKPRPSWVTSAMSRSPPPPRERSNNGTATRPSLHADNDHHCDADLGDRAARADAGQRHERHRDGYRGERGQPSRTRSGPTRSPTPRTGPCRGTYGGGGVANVNNRRVIYTASMP